MDCLERLCKDRLGWMAASIELDAAVPVRASLASCQGCAAVQVYCFGKFLGYVSGLYFLVSS